MWRPRGGPQGGTRRRRGRERGATDMNEARRMAFAPTWAVVAGGLLLAAPPAHAAEFSSGELRGSFDVTLSHGATWRTGKRKDSLTGLNSDDGGRNYDRGLVSNTSKVTGELELEHGRFGAFARVNGFVDFENENGRRAYRPLSDDAKELVGKDVEVLDLYVTGAFDAGDTAIDARLGNHVLNWGESTFIQNGINVINPFDVGKLRTPGAELRDALEPVPLVSAAVAPTPALSLEGFYQLAWKKTEIDPSGTYFSTNDYAGAGGNAAYLPNPFGTDMGGPTPGSLLDALTPAVNADLMARKMDCRLTSPAPTFSGSDCLRFHRNFMSVTRSPDRDPDDSGQWGIAARYLAENLNNTEFGFYFVNHHSRLPLVSAMYGSPAGYDRGLAAADAVSAPGTNTVAAMSPQLTPLVTQAVRQQIAKTVAAGVPDGTPQSVIDSLVATQLAAPAAQQQIAIGVQRQVKASVGSILAHDHYGDTARYFIEYPEDLKVFGVSFSTQLGASGWALQGEYSFHPDAPLQRTEGSLFADGLRPLTEGLQGRGTPELLALRGTRLQGYVERDVSQLQVTATRVFGPVAGADGMAFITEAAVMHVHDMPDKDTTPLDTGGIGDEIADATSFGYRAAARLDYNNAIGAARLSPYAQFQHDVNGSSPGPSGPFVDGRTVLTLGVGVSYLERWQGNLGYTMHGGGNNQLSDRDFISASVKYAF